MVGIKNMGQVNTNKDEPIDIGDLISEAFLLTKGKEDREELVLDYLCQSVTKADNYDALVMKAKNKEPYAYIQLASWHISHAENVKDYCKALENQEFNTYDEYNNGKRVICTTTGEIFKCQKMAADKYEIKSPSGIRGVCIGRNKTCGKLQNGTRLKWMYYEDFLKLPQEEQNEILSRNQESSNDGSFIM